MTVRRVAERSGQQSHRGWRGPARWASLPLLLLAIVCGCSMADDAADGPQEGQLSIALEGDVSPPAGSTLLLRASVSNSPYAVSRFSWAAVDPQGVVVTLKTQGVLSEEASLRAELPGSYSVSCSAVLSGTERPLEKTITVQVQDAGPQRSYTVRVIPPAEQQLPAQDLNIVVGSVDLQQDLALETGRELTLSVTHLQGPLPAYVRLLLQGSEQQSYDWWLPQGSRRLSLVGGFHALILPLEPQVPPELLENQLASRLSASWSVELSAGDQLTGLVRRDSGEPLAGSLVTLHARSPVSQVLVPSTLGQADAQGEFELRYRPLGPSSLTVVPPAASALPVAVAQEVSLATGQDSWQLVYETAQAVPTSGRVLSFDRLTPAAGAEVVLELVAPDQPVGRLLSGADEQPLWPRYQRKLQADAQGQLLDPRTGAASFLLPPGRYRAEGWPAAGAPAEQGYFQLEELQISAGDPAALELYLGRRAQLSGTVLDPQGGAVLARIRAKAPSGAFTTLSEQSGAFSLLVDPGQRYVLSAQPLVSPGQPLSRQLLEGVEVQEGGRELEVALQPAVLVSGRVVTAGGLSIPGATLRVWCSSPDCPSEQLLDEAQSTSDGGYQLRLPRQAAGQ